MSELEEFSALVGDIYDASLDRTLWPGVFCRWAPGEGATAVFTDRLKKGGGEILTSSRCPQTRILRRSSNTHGVTDENTSSHHSA